MAQSPVVMYVDLPEGQKVRFGHSDIDWLLAANMHKNFYKNNNILYVNNILDKEILTAILL